MSDDFSIPVVSLDGYQVVTSQYFSRHGQQTQPAVTIWETSISFNAAAHRALNDCESILIKIHPDIRSLAVLPVPSGSKNAVEWKMTKGKTAYRKLESADFGRKLYSDWGLDKNYRYVCLGRIVQCDQKIALLFTLSDYDLARGVRLEKSSHEH